MPENIQPQDNESGELYNRLAEITPERDISNTDEPEHKGTGDVERQSLSERIESSHNLTDMQTADKRLFPDLRQQHLNDMQVARVFPDIYNPMYHILVKDLLKKTGSSVAEALANVNTAMSIGIDGEGRLDELGLIGRASQVEMEKSKNPIV